MSYIVVLDASVFISWISASQRTEPATQLLADREQHRFIVPPIFHIEVRNALLVAERRDKWRIAESEDALAVLDGLDIVTTPVLDGIDLDEVFRLARAERLTLYDAFYLYDAITHWAALASRDGALLAAAERRGVTPLDMRAPP